MPRRKRWKRECPGKCSARDTRIREARDMEIPPEVRAHIGNETVYKCTYCSTYWFDYRYHPLELEPHPKIIGYHDLALDTGGQYWLMPDGQSRKFAGFVD